MADNVWKQGERYILYFEIIFRSAIMSRRQGVLSTDKNGKGLKISTKEADTI